MSENKRMRFGRRKSDWLVPLGFLTVGIIAAFWASYNRTRKADIERQKEALEVQVKLLERVVEHYEKDEAASATPTGRPGHEKTGGVQQADNSATATSNTASSQPGRNSPVERPSASVTANSASSSKAPSSINTAPAGNIAPSENASSTNINVPADNAAPANSAVPANSASPVTRSTS